MAKTWTELRNQRTATPEAKAAYEAARVAYEFGRRVRERRQELGLSQAELAGATGTSQPAIARLEAGGTEPTLRTITGLARVLGAVWVIGPNGVATGETDAPAPSPKLSA